MEKRQFLRIKSDFCIWYQTIDEDDVSFGRPQTKNISAGGILLEMEEGERVGATIMMKFQLPGYENEINAKGKIVRVTRIEAQRFEIGIEFIEIAPEDMQAINSLADE